ncbi:DUF1801 domain-containing protein [Candidatus Woesebacteria bacterium]|nr:DUF1801 domain-containing protein [Candidatus Woesebacteria bacterium]MCD8526881.1 DUF1801 domain-containing protein [Candidatus Woesebacteria bacterium]MCD8545781.1 DUF1801 domain-containing protein [Candidatus Woesebacteria bacterium]
MSSPISTYIAKQDQPQQEVLQKIRELIQGLLPEAEERMSYGVPSFRLDGKSILYAAFKNHIGLYPEPEVIELFQEELANYETAKGTIKFPLDKPIPYDLITRIVKQKYDKN